jgi:uncharacterized protein (DUF1015 family)
VNVLLPFRAFHSSAPAIYVSGEEPPRLLDPSALRQDAEPALYLYTQRFRFPGESVERVRRGVMGVLDRAHASIFPHEQVEAHRVAECVKAIRAGDTDPGSLWLWRDDAAGAFARLCEPAGPPTVEARDRSGCLHQMWAVTGGARIRALQAAVAGHPLFLADGHHRFAAGWNFATIQAGRDELRTLPSHRLILEGGALQAPPGDPIEAEPVEDIDAYLAAAPKGRTRCVAVVPGPRLQGFELPTGAAAQSLIPGAVVQPVREIAEAIAAVESGRAKMALLLAPLSIAQIERDASRGILLPAKSTDFYPKLAAGLVMHRS